MSLRRGELPRDDAGLKRRQAGEIDDSGVIGGLFALSIEWPVLDKLSGSN